MMLKYLNVKGALGENYWRILIDGDDLVGQAYMGQYGSETEFIIGIDANGVELSKHIERPPWK